MKLIRVIAIYDKAEENLLSEQVISEVPLEKLKTILTAKKDDPELLQIYSLGETEIEAFAAPFPQLREFDSSQVEMYYECFAE